MRPTGNPSGANPLNQEYDRFHARFGAVSDQANVRAFAGDPDLPLLLSLENFNEETRRATKTAIFRERTIQHQKPAESAQIAKEALLISLNENGKVDLAAHELVAQEAR